MFDFGKGTAGVKNKKIVGWVIWWQTPLGMMDTMEGARERLEELDLDPVMCMFPVPVAMLEDGDYEIFRRV